MILHNLIKKFGQPDALIDHWDATSKRYAVWGFDEEFLINNTGTAMVNGTPVNGPPMQILQNTLNKWKDDNDGLASIGFISYDLKNFFYPHISFRQSNSSYPLLWFGKPKQVIPYNITEIEHKSPLPFLHLEKDIPHPSEYENAI